MEFAFELYEVYHDNILKIQEGGLQKDNKFDDECFEGADYFMPIDNKLKEFMQTLLDQGKHLFLYSDYHPNYLDLVLYITLGKNWQEDFDLVLCNTKGQLFFKAENPFFDVVDNQVVASSHDLYNMKEYGARFFYKGNSQILVNYYRYVLNSFKVQTAVFDRSNMNAIGKFDCELQTNMEEKLNVQAHFHGIVLPIPGAGQMQSNYFRQQMARSARYIMNEDQSLDVLLKSKDVEPKQPFQDDSLLKPTQCQPGH